MKEINLKGVIIFFCHLSKSVAPKESFFCFVSPTLVVILQRWLLFAHDAFVFLMFCNNYAGVYKCTNIECYFSFISHSHDCKCWYFMSFPKTAMMFKCKSENLQGVGWHCYTKSQKPNRAMWFSHSLDPKDSKKPKFDHLEGRLVVLAKAWSLWSELH